MSLPLALALFTQNGELYRFRALNIGPIQPFRSS